MSAREMQGFFGSLIQDVPDQTITKEIPIVIQGRRAIQIYQLSVSIAGGYLFGQATNGSFQFTLQAVSKSGTTVKMLFRWSQAIITIGAVVGVGVLDLNEIWTPPPSFVLGDHHLLLTVESTNMTMEFVMEYQIYYKPVGISDIQALQLSLM